MLAKHVLLQKIIIKDMDNEQSIYWFAKSVYKTDFFIL